jgi:hypothetical protein
MVTFYRAGHSLREVAETFNESKSTIQRWVKFAEGQRLDRVNFYNNQTGSATPSNQYSKRVEDRVLRVRQFLKDKSILGLFGADTIRNTMIERGDREVPSRRTIVNIIKRHGLVDHRVRRRYPSPPPGWYLQDLVSKSAELDSGDIVEKLYLLGGQEVQLFNVISLHGSLLYSVADKVITSEIVVDALTEHWRTFGLPRYVQFDNDMVFQGNRKKNTIGRVIRFCLSLGVIPVFTPPYEQGFQGKIERFNGEIQRKFWRRKYFKNIRNVKERLKEYVLEHRLHQQSTIVTAPPRRVFPKRWNYHETTLKLRKNAMIIYLRRTDEHGSISVLENDFLVSRQWLNRLVRAEIDLVKGVIRFYALIRDDWKKYRLIKTIKFNIKKLIKNNKKNKKQLSSKY